MKNIKSFQNYSQKNEAWNSFLRGPKTDDAGRDALRGRGYSHTGTDDLHGKNPTKYIEFGGRKFYERDLVYAQYDDMGEIPRIEARIEGDKLIIANPAWNE
jgi:hypothetical protein